LIGRGADAVSELARVINDGYQVGKPNFDKREMPTRRSNSTKGNKPLTHPLPSWLPEKTSSTM